MKKSNKLNTVKKLKINELKKKSKKIKKIKKINKTKHKRKVKILTKKGGTSDPNPPNIPLNPSNVVVDLSRSNTSNSNNNTVYGFQNNTIVNGTSPKVNRKTKPESFGFGTEESPLYRIFNENTTYPKYIINGKKYININGEMREIKNDITNISENNEEKTDLINFFKNRSIDLSNTNQTNLNQLRNLREKYRKEELAPFISAENEARLNQIV